MSDPERRTPPRFVPTLTEVVGPPRKADSAKPPAPPERMPLPESARQGGAPRADRITAPGAATPAALRRETDLPASPAEPASTDAPADAAPPAQEPAPAAAPASLSEADLANVVTRLILRSDFQDRLAQAVATVVAQQVHAQLSGQVASLYAQLPELVEQSVQQAISDALRKA
jgi:hypothetical protein